MQNYDISRGANRANSRGLYRVGAAACAFLLGCGGYFRSKAITSLVSPIFIAYFCGHRNSLFCIISPQGSHGCFPVEHPNAAVVRAMSIRVALNHKTRYRYAKPVWLSPHVVRLRPAPHSRTPVHSYSLKITPSEHFINWQQDPYSNHLARLVFPKKTSEFCVEVDLVAELTVINAFDFFLEKYAEEFPFHYDSILLKELSPYLEAGAPGPKLQELIRELRRQEVRTVDYLVDLNQQLQQRTKYLIRMEPGIQNPEETLTLQSGSCRDSAWLQVQLLRHLGLAARFVSGYLIQLSPDVKSLDGPSGPEKDFTDLHAWTEVYLPGAGWIGLDATSGLLADEGHIPLACSADPLTAAAITGSFSADNESIVTSEDGAEGEVDDEFEFSMSVTRIHEDPRVTKPYTEEQWVEIQGLGHQVDAEMKKHDLRLTLGGEPTFVSIDDMDGEEWNTVAMGPNKYRLADTLARRLRTRFAPGGLLHHGQGKWYPGESLPRWALGLYWRKDGQPIWRDPELTADETGPVRLTEADANNFIAELAHRLEVEPKHAIPGYEDVWYYLWKERRLPTNVDPFDSKLQNPEDRARLARVFEQGLDKVVGYALPLRREYYTDDTKANTRTFTSVIPWKIVLRCPPARRWQNSPVFRDLRRHAIRRDLWNKRSDRNLLGLDVRGSEPIPMICHLPKVSPRRGLSGRLYALKCATELCASSCLRRGI